LEEFLSLEGNCCSTDNCVSCVDGACVVCGGDPNQFCCVTEDGDICCNKGQRCCTFYYAGYDLYLPYCCNSDQPCCNGHCCDPNDCETCVDGYCQVCGGDPNKICCDNGSCVKPCELEAVVGQCDKKTVQCPECGSWCSDYYKIVYTGNTVYRCKEPGCPGDCQDTEVHCYTRTRCDIYNKDWLHCIVKCVFIPYTYGLCPDCEAGYSSDPNYQPQKFYVPSKKCN